jgi:hypothetical protein
LFKNQFSFIKNEVCYCEISWFLLKIIILKKN